VITPKGGFVEPLGRAHPLVGSVWSQAEQREIPAQLLYSHLRASSWLVLGESHDNRDHHLLEAHFLDVFLSAHPTASVGFEMLDETQAPALTPPLPSTAAEFAARVHWAQSGWPDFAQYEPVFALLLDRHARLFAAHPSRDHVHEAMHALSPELARSLHLDQPLPQGLHNALAQEIRDSHCGYAPEAMVEPMVSAQVFKDAWMARALVSEQAPAALVTGRGHADETRGVPRAMRMQGVSDVLTIALIEVDDARKQPSQYDVEAYDFAVFTPRTSDESACDRFRKQLVRMREQESQKR
jgi:uncharacterized iron-regulated protein